ncbi:MAG: hypothetical protein ACJ760_00835 [Thermoleophilaceae bacterium]
MGRAHAEDHLLVERAKWHGGVPGLGIVTAGGFDPREHFAAQVGTLAAVGLLDPDEASAWWRRFDEGAGPPRVEPDDELRGRAERYLESVRDDDEAASAALNAFAGIGLLTMHDAVERLAVDDEPWDDEELPDIGAGDLRRVVLGPTEEAGGFRLLAAELYPGGIVVRWTAQNFPEPITVSDDAGTAYEEQDIGGDRSDDHRLRGQATFTPAAPPTATRLAIEVPGGRLELAL